MIPFVPSVRTLEAALRDLRHAKASVRRAAAADLGRQAPEHQDRAVAALVAALAPTTEPDASVRAAAAESLAYLEDGAACAPLLAAAEGDQDVHVRELAVMALGALLRRSPGDESLLAYLSRALEDPEPRIRFQAVIAVARAADRERAIAALVAATDDDDPLVCHIALRMGEELGGEELPVPALVYERARRLLAHEAPVVRIAAAIVRARGGDKAATPLLVDVVEGRLATTEAEDEAAASELAGELGVVAARRGLERRAFGGAFGIGGDRYAWHARVALARLGHARAIAWIRRDLRAFSRARRTLAVAAAGRARLLDASPELEAMQDDARRADPDAVREALALLKSAV